MRRRCSTRPRHCTPAPATRSDGVAPCWRSGACVAAFDELGAAGWAAEGRIELARIGGRTRTEGLSPSEQRVAALVAQGRTNREIGAELFLGERTVASHLTHIYAKLGIRS